MSAVLPTCPEKRLENQTTDDFRSLNDRRQTISDRWIGCARRWPIFLWNLILDQTFTNCESSL